MTGYGECSDGKNPWGVVGVVQDLKPLLIGQDPRAFEMRFWDMIRGTRQSPGGIAAKGIAGVELALLDIKARALGISVVELFGGPLREEVRLYWSHCGTTRTAHYRHVQCEPLRNLSDVGALGREVVAKGYTALKTNIIFPGDAPFAYFPGFARGPGTTDQAITPQLLGPYREHHRHLSGGRRTPHRHQPGPQFQLQTGSLPPDRPSPGALQPALAGD